MINVQHLELDSDNRKWDGHGGEVPKMSFHSFLSALYVQSCCRDISYRMFIQFQSEQISEYTKSQAQMLRR